MISEMINSGFGKKAQNSETRKLKIRNLELLHLKTPKFESIQTKKAQISKILS